MNDQAKLKKILKLSSEAQKCRLCRSLCDRTVVPSELNGSIAPKVTCVAEAADRRPHAKTLLVYF